MEIAVKEKLQMSLANEFSLVLFEYFVSYIYVEITAWRDRVQFVVRF